MQDPAFIREVIEKSTQLVSKAELMAAFDQMTDKMRDVLADKNPVLLCVMNGGLMTMSEIAMRLEFPLQMDYLHATRYMGETSGGAKVFWRREPSVDLTDRVVVIVDDILDGGITLQAIKEFCEGEGASEVYSAVMLDKEVEREPGGAAHADFTGMRIEDKYVYGFGLDYHEYLRNMPGIYSVAEEHM